jgi:hypothetical protein
MCWAPYNRQYISRAGLPIIERTTAECAGLSIADMTSAECAGLPIIDRTAEELTIQSVGGFPLQTGH